jgi:hypothetical protein
MESRSKWESWAREAGRLPPPCAKGCRMLFDWIGPASEGLGEFGVPALVSLGWHE